MKTLVALAATAALALSPTAAHAAGSVSHTGPNWSWTGPADWTASYGTYGITVQGDHGAVLDLGFSSTVCASGSTYDRSVDAYFKSLDKQVKKSGFRFDDAKVTHPSGYPKTYRRQVLEVVSKKHGLTGEMVLDYDFSTSVDGVNYCYQRSLATYAATSSWRTLRKTLDKVEKSLAYSGPGVGGEDPTRG